MEVDVAIPFDLFISYVHPDNQRGQVRDLRNAIAEDFVRLAGRSLNKVFDEDGIRNFSLVTESVASNYSTPFDARDWRSHPMTLLHRDSYHLYRVRK